MGLRGVVASKEWRARFPVDDMLAAGEHGGASAPMADEGKKSNKTGKHRCFHCGSEDHWTSDCPELDREQREQLCMMEKLNLADHCCDCKHAAREQVGQDGPGPKGETSADNEGVRAAKNPGKQLEPKGNDLQTAAPGAGASPRDWTDEKLIDALVDTYVRADEYGEVPLSTALRHEVEDLLHSGLARADRQHILWLRSLVECSGESVAWFEGRRISGEKFRYALGWSLCSVAE